MSRKPWSDNRTGVSLKSPHSSLPHSAVTEPLLQCRICLPMKTKSPSTYIKIFDT